MFHTKDVTNNTPGRAGSKSGRGESAARVGLGAARLKNLKTTHSA